MDYDSGTAMTGVRLVLDGGKYFLWTERPRIEVTFHYVGTALTTTPDSVEIRFRTQSPRFASTNRLTLETGDWLSTTSTTAVASSVRQHMGHVDHVLTFQLAARSRQPDGSAWTVAAEWGPAALL